MPLNEALGLRGSVVEFSKYKFEWILLLIGILCSVASILFDVQSTENTIWFARSGAIIVLVSAIVEYRLSSFIYADIAQAAQKTALKLASMPKVSDNRMVEAMVKSNLIIKPEASKPRKILSAISHVFIITGTIVWAYGDLVVS